MLEQGSLTNRDVGAQGCGRYSYAWRLAQEAEVGDHLAQIYERTGRRADAIRTYALALAAERPSDDIKVRLATLAGGMDEVDGLVAQHREELAAARSTPIAAKGAAGKTADFFVLLSSPGTVENVRFVSGDETLRPLGGLIASALAGPALSRRDPGQDPAQGDPRVRPLGQLRVHIAAARRRRTPQVTLHPAALGSLSPRVQRDPDSSWWVHRTPV